MMTFLPSEDGFLTQLQETGQADFMCTMTDDLVISIDTIRARISAALAIEDVRIFPQNTAGVFTVEVR